METQFVQSLWSFYRDEQEVRGRSQRVMMSEEEGTEAPATAEQRVGQSEARTWPKTKTETKIVQNYLF